MEAAGGVWPAVEPQVYDALLLAPVEQALGVAASDGVLRFTLDPEALPDYPTAQLMAFGNPLLDRIFEHAQSLGQTAQVYLTGFNVSPHDLPSTVRRSLQVPAGVEVRSGPPRAHHFSAALFWFQATFISDEKVQDIFAVGIERYYGRLARTLMETLRSVTRSDTRSYPYPDAPGLPLPRAYQLAREEATRAVTVAAHSHLAELSAISSARDPAHHWLLHRPARAGRGPGRRHRAIRSAAAGVRAGRTGAARRLASQAGAPRLDQITQCAARHSAQAAAARAIGSGARPRRRD
jgi:hypothetical protein